MPPVSETDRKLAPIEARIKAYAAAVADTIGGQKGKELAAKFEEIDKYIADLYSP